MSANAMEPGGHDSDKAADGCLWVVATPIGNAGDLSPRAVRTLSQATLVLAEDTRESAPLLTAAGVQTPLRALHEHNEAELAEALVARLLAGEQIALISDAGTPLVSDPGYRLVRAARAAGVAVRPVPGPCAPIAALSVSGLATDRFCFEGFLPASAGARRERLRALALEPRTLLFFEAPHRIEETLEACIEVFGSEREACLARELTKRFETVWTAPLGTLRERVRADPNARRGEIVLAVAGAPDDGDEALRRGRELYRALSEDLSPSQAAKIAARIAGVPKRALYGGA